MFFTWPIKKNTYYVYVIYDILYIVCTNMKQSINRKSTPYLRILPLTLIMGGTCQSLLTACNPDVEEIAEKTPLDTEWPDISFPTDTIISLWDILRQENNNGNVTFYIENKETWTRQTIWTVTDESGVDPNSTYISFNLNPQTVNQDINAEWPISIHTADNKWNISDKTWWYVKMEHLSWLDWLKNLELEIGKEVNLIKWIYYNQKSLDELISKWSAYMKYELKWKIYDIEDPTHFTPQIPWIYKFNIYIDGKLKTFTEKTVDPEKYEEIKLSKSPYIHELYPWIEKYPSEQPFVKHMMPFCEISYISNTYWNLPITSFILWDSENSWHWIAVSNNLTAFSNTNLTFLPNQDREYVYNYAIEHPDKFVYSVCANNSIAAYTPQKLYENEKVKQMSKFLLLPNSFADCSAWNTSYNVRTLNNEFSTPTEYIPKYNIASINSTHPNGTPLYNKYTSVWTDFNTYYNNDSTYITPYNPEIWTQTRLTIWFSNDKWNVCICWPDINNPSNQASSEPAGSTAWEHQNMVRIIHENYPHLSFQEINKYIAENYLVRMDKYTYKDTTSINYDYKPPYAFDATKFQNEEIYHISELKNLNFNSEYVDLPHNKRTFYSGFWVEYKVNGSDKRYTPTEGNKDKMDNITWWRRNKGLFLRQWWEIWEIWQWWGNLKLKISCIDLNGGEIGYTIVLL